MASLRQLGGGPRPLTLVDVEDVVELMLLLAERDEALGQAFFVAGPEHYSLLAFALAGTLKSDAVNIRVVR